jgi:pyridoxal phosphate enzyme (YggS family)
MSTNIEQNLFLINEKITKACNIYNRDKSTINLIAVSKTVESLKIFAAIQSGCQIFAENYVQEAAAKWLPIKKNHPEIKLHLIGHLQSNKAAQAVDLFDCIESLDSEKLAKSLAKEMLQQQKFPEVFIQVNLGEEVQKNGLNPLETPDFIAFTRNECGLNVNGLMGIPPANEPAAPYFALLAKIAKSNNLPNISMGMSADFEAAIALGATHIRLGTAIFGDRI